MPRQGRTGTIFALVALSWPSPQWIPRAQPGRAQASQPETSALAPNEAEVEALIDAHNRERSSASPPLPPLVRNQKLEAAALAQARDMARHETLSHESRDGSTLPQRVERQRYSYRGIAENIAYGPTESSKVLQMWMLSAPHRKNLMGDYSDVGVARVDSSKGVPYWAVVFGKPKAQSSP